MCDIDAEAATATRLCETLNAVVVSVEYRLAPEHPYPAGVEDCYAGLAWMERNAEALGFDSRRLAVFGTSAGGGLTTATTLLARDRSGPSICFQMPIYPMIDDRDLTPSSRAVTDIGMWDRATNIEALPPTFIDVGEMDVFRDEDIAFAAALRPALAPALVPVADGRQIVSANSYASAMTSRTNLGATQSPTR